LRSWSVTADTTMMFQAVALTAPILLTAMPKALAMVGILVLLLPWGVRSLIGFTTAVIEKLPQMVT